MWIDFDGKPYTREEFKDLLDSIPAARLSWCKFLTVHNTAAPSLAQWMGPKASAAQRIKNLQRYYEVERGWRAGPHAFIPPDRNIVCYGFTKFTVPGIHASCFNSQSIGLEMVGDFESEEFTFGPGAIVRENAIFVLAALHLRMGLRPDGYVYGKSGLHFHVDCKRDQHACPGKKVNRDDLVRAVLAEMRRQEGAPLIAGDPDPSVGVSGSIGVAAAAVTNESADEPFSPPAPEAVVPTVAGESRGWMDRFGADSLYHLNELASQASRLATSTLGGLRAMLRTILSVLGIGGAAVGANTVGLIDPNKGAPAVAEQALRPFPVIMVVVVTVMLTTVIVGGLALLYFKRVKKGVVSASKDGRYTAPAAAAKEA